jgi:hypothetical protein
VPPREPGTGGRRWRKIGATASRHALHAVEDSAILLTVSMAVHPDRS